MPWIHPESSHNPSLCANKRVAETPRAVFSPGTWVPQVSSVRRPILLFSERRPPQGTCMPPPCWRLHPRDPAGTRWTGGRERGAMNEWMGEAGRSLTLRGLGSPAPGTSWARPGTAALRSRLSVPFWHSVAPPPPGPSPEGAVAELGVVPLQHHPQGGKVGEGPGS